MSAATIWVGAAFAADLFFWHLSIVTTSVANATFFATTAPIWVVVFGWLLFRKRVSKTVLAGVGLCIVGGTGLLVQSAQTKTQTTLGNLYGLATGIFFGLYFLAMQAAREGNSAARVTFHATLITAALLLITVLNLEHQFLAQTLHGIAALVALAWVSHAGGQGLLTVALGRLPAAFSSYPRPRHPLKPLLPPCGSSSFTPLLVIVTPAIPATWPKNPTIQIRDRGPLRIDWRVDPP